jgi:PKD repeat protein
MSTEPVPSPPSAIFTSNVQTGIIPLTVQFTDQSTGTTPLTYAWDFKNDGTVDSTVRNPSYTYTSAGTYTVNLTVTNIAGSDSELKTGYIIANQAPIPTVAAFISDVQSGTAPLLVHFSDQSSNTPTLWKWEYRTDTGSWTEFGSGTRNPSYTFAAGTYDIRLTATNAGGFDSELKTDYITAGTPTSPPIAYFTTNVTSGTAPLAVKFTDTSINTPTTWVWSFTNVTGNNTPVMWSTVQSPTRTFGVGNFSIMLNASNSGGHGISSQVTFINVTATPVLRTTASKIGTYNPTLSLWYLDYNGNGLWEPGIDKVYTWGAPGYQPVTGDWNFDGKVKIGTYNPDLSLWYLDYNGNGLWEPGTDKVYTWGAPGYAPVVGKWS